MKKTNVRAHLSRLLAGQKLFLKIFLWFWLTVIGLLLAFVVLPQLFSVQVMRPPNLNAAIAPLLASQATHAYETEGAAGFRRFAHENVEDNDKVLYLLDGNYNDVLSRPVPEDGLRLAHGVHARELTIYRSRIGAFRFVSASGHPYVFLLYLNKELTSVLGKTTLQHALYPVAILLIATLLCYLLARHIAGPVLAIQIAARQVSLGNLQARAPARLLKRHDEMRELTLDFNIMVERIESLVQSHKRLLASVSHEVRSPLTRLSISVAMLRRLNHSDAASLLGRIDREVLVIDVLMSQLLTLARLEGGTRRSAPAPVDLQELLEEIVVDAAFEVEPDDKEVQLNCSAPIILAIIDGAALRSAFENVIHNAARFTRPGTSVEVTASSLPDRSTSISVRDHGPGVPDEHLHDIFKAFFRVPTDGECLPGNGLGLTIAAEAIALQRGAIVARNHELGGGLEVVVTLPASSRV